MLWCGTKLLTLETDVHIPFLIISLRFENDINLPIVFMF